MTPASDEQLYSELGEFQRFTLRWREGLFQGFLLVLGSLTLGLYTALGNESLEIKKLSWIIPLAGALVAVIFSLVDQRCHEILIRNYHLGSSFENSVGIYRASQNRSGGISHTAVLQSLYLGSCGALLILFTILLFKTAGGESIMAAEVVSIVATHSVLSFAFLLVFGLLGSFLGFRLITANYMKLGTATIITFVLCVSLLLFFVPETRPITSETFLKTWNTARQDDPVLRIIEKASQGKKITEEERALLTLWLKQFKVPPPPGEKKESPIISNLGKN
jgi:hypothetical protein